MIIADISLLPKCFHSQELWSCGCRAVIAEVRDARNIFFSSPNAAIAYLLAKEWGRGAVGNPQPFCVRSARRWGRAPWDRIMVKRKQALLWRVDENTWKRKHCECKIWIIALEPQHFLMNVLNFEHSGSDYLGPMLNTLLFHTKLVLFTFLRQRCQRYMGCKSY